MSFEKTSKQARAKTKRQLNNSVFVYSLRLIHSKAVTIVAGILNNKSKVTVVSNNAEVVKACYRV